MAAHLDALDAWQASVAAVRAFVGEQKWPKDYDSERWARAAAALDLDRPRPCIVVMRAGDGCFAACIAHRCAATTVALLDDRYFSRHTRYLVRELRVLVYTQFLDAYKTVTLASMAEAFGVGVDFLDGELARFISCGRLNAKVDKVAMVVETNRPDYKSQKYQQIIKQGDILLNRIQQLARCVSI